MKNKKMILGIVLFMATAVLTFAQQYDSENDFEAEPVNGGKSVRITGYEGKKWTVNIPPRIQGLPVTHIESSGGRATMGYGVFQKKKLINVTIPETVTTIGTYAFIDNQLTSVTIPDSVTTIGNSAFMNNQLTSITIPNNVTTIEYWAFFKNPLTSVVVSSNVKSIGPGVFFSNQLTSITIGAGVELTANYDADYPTAPSFGSKFEIVYNNGGKRAGTYTRPDTKSTNWTRKN